nr:methyl-accepting chemotaxis protein [Devosia chinhatensis]
MSALRRSHAIIEFTPAGEILDANDNFLRLMGYSLDEIVNKHHRMFVDPDEQRGPEYRAFWDALAHGEFKSMTFRRFGKRGKEIWIEASYNPIVDEAGVVIRVVKLASDITAKHVAAREFQRQMEAASRSQAIIEFALDGTVLTANDNFCAAMGYEQNEIVGRHHSMFVDPAEAKSEAYAEFWRKLGSGQFQAAEYRRVGKGGRNVWIQATYNPMMNAEGLPYKVIKYATDITLRKAAVEEIDRCLNCLADGDLSVSIAGPFPQELETVRHAFNESVGKLAGTMTNLQAASNIMRSHTSDILAGSGNLSDRTLRQAEAIAEAGGSMISLKGGAEETEARALSALDNAKSLDESVSKTQTVMEAASVAMTAISDDSRKISAIVGLIDDIAFQTNLLALNASVEAARAGEAGKGFAVVAIEVRRLAQSAATASGDIKQLIDKSAETVRGGNQLVADAANRLQSMAADIGRNRGLADEIAKENARQRASVEELSALMAELDGMTQRNATLVEQTNASIADTETQAKRLDDLLSAFRFPAVGEKGNARVLSSRTATRKTAA